jgi:hypothetical protein
VNHNPADIVTARALRHGLDTAAAAVVVVAGELVELARGDRRTLEASLVRVERGLADRASPVGERARDVLERALALVVTGRDAERRRTKPRDVTRT